MRFINDDGYIKTRDSYSRQMSAKQAIEYSAERYEFILVELRAGRKVLYDGISALCLYAEKMYNKCEGFTHSCQGCPVFHKTGQVNCLDTPYFDMRNDVCLNFSFRIPRVRTHIRFLRALENTYVLGEP